MTLQDYVKYRKNIHELANNVNTIDKNKYNINDDDYELLINLAKDNIKKNELENTKNHEIHWEDYLNWFFIGSGIFLSLLFQLGYADTESRKINIGAYLFWVITVPIIIFISANIYKYKQANKENSNCFKKLLSVILKIKFIKSDIFKDVIKQSACYQIQFTSIAYSISSIILLLYHTGIKKYIFIWDSTWIGSVIINLYTIPLNFIYSDLIPAEINNISTEFSVGIDSENWLWFLIVLTIIWVIIPRIIILSYYSYKLKKYFKKYLTNNSDSVKLLEDLRKQPENNEDIKDNEDNKNKIFDKFDEIASQTKELLAKVVIKKSLNKTKDNLLKKFSLKKD
ncbi:hypothetical protein [Aliarcobacter skirrowii]|uniref:hypothetical protein n=1 Tax=Aliarcobacter skirrowii TaxID=28200 RepID=UPI002A35DBD3|nr:hypothetical protein [Aliarcobacter skirrowii]MDY0179802.1 hypothetical protein [Aliarcobacter skirrowii]